MTFPVTINSNTYNESDFINYGHLTSFPNIIADVATVAGQVVTNAATVAADKATVAADKATVAADKATVAANKALTETYKNQALAAAVGAQLPTASTGGTSTAYTFTNANLTIGDSAAIRCNFHTVCGSSPTLQETTDGNAYEIVARGNRSLDAGEIATGASYILLFDTAINKWIVQNLEMTQLSSNVDANGFTIDNLRTYDEAVRHQGYVKEHTDTIVKQFDHNERLHNINGIARDAATTVTFTKNGTSIGGLTSVAIGTSFSETAVNDSSNAYIDFAAGDYLGITTNPAAGSRDMFINLDLERRP